MRGDLSATKLQQTGRTSEVDVILAKKELLEHLLHEELNQLPFTSSAKSALRSALASSKSYRAKEGFGDNEFAKHDIPKDVSYKQSFTRSEMLFDSFAATLIYGKAYDRVIVQCLRLAKTPKEMCAYGAIGQDLQKIYDSTEEPKKEDAKAEDDKEKAEDGKAGDATEAKEDDDEEMDEALEAQSRWYKHSENLVDTFVRIIAPGPNEQTMIQELKPTPAIQAAEHTSNEKVLVVYNSKQEGQNKTQPHLRMPPNRAHYIARVVQSTLKATCPLDYERDPDALTFHEKLVFLYIDAYKPDNQDVFAKTFVSGDKKLDKVVTKYVLTYEETSLRRRRVRDCPAHVQFPVVEGMIAVSAVDLDLTPKPRLLFPNSSNMNNHIGLLVTMDPADRDEWTMTVHDKKQLLGDSLVEGGDRGPPGTEQQKTDRQTSAISPDPPGPFARFPYFPPSPQGNIPGGKRVELIWWKRAKGTGGKGEIVCLRRPRSPQTWRGLRSTRTALTSTRS